MKLKFSRVASSLIAVAAVGIFTAVYGAATSGKLFMNGNLSLKHEGLENDCSACHEAWEGVKNKACLSCHETAIHFSGMKVSGSGDDGPKTENLGCPECHREHRGRSNNLKFAGLYKCFLCHLSGGHAASKRSQSAKPEDEAAILFTHKKHVEYGAFDKDSCETCHKGLSEKAGFTVKNMYKEECGGCHYLRSHDANTKINESCGMCHPGGRILTQKKKNESLLKSFMYSHLKHAGFKCVDCHESLMTTGKMASGGSTLPETCVDCHKHERLNISCVSCHQYHALTET